MLSPLLALIAGVVPCLPGFLATVADVKVPAAWIRLYDYAWFVSFGLSFAVYAAWMRCAPGFGVPAIDRGPVAQR